MLQTSRIFTWPRCLIPVACLFLPGWAATPCHAQREVLSGGESYKQLPLRNVEKHQKNRSEIRRIIRDRIPAGKEKILKDYYEEYFFPVWTIPKDRPDSNNLTFPVLRSRLRTNFELAQDPKTFDTLLKIVFDNLAPLATSPEYSPAVRFNAAYMIGRLNAKYTPRRTVPVAYPKALDILFPLLDNPNENDAVRFGAILGIVRHAQFNTDVTDHSKIIGALLRQTMNQTLPTNRSPEGHEWFRTTAIEGLAHAKGEEVDEVAPALVKIINDETETDSLRRAAANSIGKLPVTPDTETNSAVTTRSLGELASKAVRQEIEACEKNTEKTIDPGLLMSQLLPIQIALSGSEKHVSSPKQGLAAAAKDKAFLEKVWKLVDAWYGKLDNKSLIPDDTIPPDRAMSKEPSPARVATEELIHYFKLQLQEMDNLIGAARKNR